MSALDLSLLKKIRSMMRSQNVAQSFLTKAIDTFNCNGGALLLINPSSKDLEIESISGSNASSKTPPPHRISHYVASDGKSRHISDTSLYNQYITLNPQIRSELASPIFLRGQIIGVLEIYSSEVSFFSEKNEKKLLEIAQEAAFWIESSWHLSRAKKTSLMNQRLLDASQEILIENEFDRALQKITFHAVSLLQASFSSILLLSEDGKTLHLKKTYGKTSSPVDTTSIPLEASLLSSVIKRKQPVALNNIQDNFSYLHTEFKKEKKLTSLLAVPLLVSEEPMGVLIIYKKTKHRFSNEEILLLSSLAKISSITLVKTQTLNTLIEQEEKLRQSERLSTLGLLTAEIAHEIRNPLTVLQMLFHQLTDSLPLKKEEKRDADVMKEKMKQMNRILDQSLNLARSSEPKKESILISSLFDDLLILVRYKLRKHHISIHTSIASENLKLKADRTQVEQTILNLILNSLQAMPKGGKINLRAKKMTLDKTPMIAIEVEDNGPGLPSQKKQSVFKLFLTHKRKGTGIGLAIVQKIIESHRGKIQLHSKPNQGTKIKLLFPLE